jgi:hypothetical protein
LNKPAILSAVRVTRWDALVLLRAAVAATLALVVAWLITAVTDEGVSAWAERAGRTLPLAPLCAAAGAWGALAQVRARGEALTLQALGRSRAEVAGAAVLGGAAIALVAAFGMGAAPSVDVAGFYPTAPHAASWRWRDGAFVAYRLGLRVGEDGAPERIESPTDPPVPAGIPRGGRAAAALSTALAGIALPMLVAHVLLSPKTHTGRARRRKVAVDQASAWIAAGTAAAASIILFQAAAAHRSPAMLGVLPPALLLAFAAGRYRASP